MPETRGMGTGKSSQGQNRFAFAVSDASFDINLATAYMIVLLGRRVVEATARAASAR